jgi:hypothetical protein
MKFKKIYHALSADPQNKWVPSWHETVDIEEQFAEEQNQQFDITGVKYELDETAEAEAEAEASVPETNSPEPKK